MLFITAVIYRNTSYLRTSEPGRCSNSLRNSHPPALVFASWPFPVDRQRICLSRPRSLEPLDLGNEDGATPKEKPPGKPRTRRYSDREKDWVVRQLSAEHGTVGRQTAPLRRGFGTHAGARVRCRRRLGGARRKLQGGDEGRRDSGGTVAR